MHQIVAQVWQTTRVHGTPMHVLSKKLQAIKEVRGWAKTIKGECDKTITQHSNRLEEV